MREETSCEINDVEIPTTENFDNVVKQAKAVVSKLRRANVRRLSAESTMRLKRIASDIETQLQCCGDECNMLGIEPEAVSIAVCNDPERCKCEFETFVDTCIDAKNEFYDKCNAAADKLRVVAKTASETKSPRVLRLCAARTNRIIADLTADAPANDGTMTKQEFNKNFNRLNNKNIRNKLLKQCLDKSEVRSYFPDGVPTLSMNLSVADLDKLKKCIRIYKD